MIPGVAGEVHRPRLAFSFYYDQTVNPKNLEVFSKPTGQNLDAISGPPCKLPGLRNYGSENTETKSFKPFRTPGNEDVDINVICGGTFVHVDGLDISFTNLPAPEPRDDTIHFGEAEEPDHGFIFGETSNVRLKMPRGTRAVYDDGFLVLNGPSKCQINGNGDLVPDSEGEKSVVPAGDLAVQLQSYGREREYLASHIRWRKEIAQGIDKYDPDVFGGGSWRVFFPRRMGPPKRQSQTLEFPGTNRPFELFRDLVLQPPPHTDVVVSRPDVYIFPQESAVLRRVTAGVTWMHGMVVFGSSRLYFAKNGTDSLLLDIAEEVQLSKLALSQSKKKRCTPFEPSEDFTPLGEGCVRVYHPSYALEPYVEGAKMEFPGFWNLRQPVESATTSELIGTVVYGENWRLKNHGHLQGLVLEPKPLEDLKVPPPTLFATHRVPQHCPKCPQIPTPYEEDHIDYEGRLVYFPKGFGVWINPSFNPTRIVIHDVQTEAEKTEEPGFRPINFNGAHLYYPPYTDIFISHEVHVYRQADQVLEAFRFGPGAEKNERLLGELHRTDKYNRIYQLEMDMAKRAERLKEVREWTGDIIAQDEYTKRLKEVVLTDFEQSFRRADLDIPMFHNDRYLDLCAAGLMVPGVDEEMLLEWAAWWIRKVFKAKLEEGPPDETRKKLKGKMSRKELAMRWRKVTEAIDVPVPTIGPVTCPCGKPTCVDAPLWTNKKASEEVDISALTEEVRSMSLKTAKDTAKKGLEYQVAKLEGMTDKHLAKSISDVQMVMDMTQPQKNLEEEGGVRIPTATEKAVLKGNKRLALLAEEISDGFRGVTGEHRKILVKELGLDAPEDGNTKGLRPSKVTNKAVYKKGDMDKSSNPADKASPGEDEGAIEVLIPNKAIKVLVPDEAAQKEVPKEEDALEKEEEDLDAAIPKEVLPDLDGIDVACKLSPGKELVVENCEDGAVKGLVEMSSTPADNGVTKKQEDDKDESLETETLSGSLGVQETLPSGCIVLGEDHNAVLEKFISLYRGN